MLHQALPDVQCSHHRLPTRTSKELALTLARLQPLADSVITPEWARRHFIVIAAHMREELAAAIEAGL